MVEENNNKKEEKQELLKPKEPQEKEEIKEELVRTSNLEDDLDILLNSSEKNAITNLYSNSTIKVQAASNSEETNSTSSYQKVKEFTMKSNGTITFSFERRSGDGSNCYYKIEKNNSSIEEDLFYNSSYSVYTTSFNVSDEDTISLYIRHGAGTDTAYIKNVRILYEYPEKPSVDTGGENTDLQAIDVMRLGGDILYYDGTDLKRLAPGSSEDVLQTNGSGSAPSWTSPSGVGEPTESASNTVKNTNNDETSIASSVTTYTKVKEIELNEALAGCRAYCEYKTSGTSPHDAYLKFYLNGTAVSSGHTNNTTSYSSETYDLSNLSSGDKIQVYAKTGGNETAYYRNFQLRYTREITTAGGYTLTNPLEIEDAISTTNTLT